MFHSLGIPNFFQVHLNHMSYRPMLKHFAGISSPLTRRLLLGPTQLILVFQSSLMTMLQSLRRSHLTLKIVQVHSILAEELLISIFFMYYISANVQWADGLSNFYTRSFLISIILYIIVCSLFSLELNEVGRFYSSFALTSACKVILRLFCAL